MCIKVARPKGRGISPRRVRAISAGRRSLTKRSESKVRGRRSSRVELFGRSRSHLLVSRLYESTIPEFGLTFDREHRALPRHLFVRVDKSRTLLRRVFLCSFAVVRGVDA